MNSIVFTADKNNIFNAGVCAIGSNQIRITFYDNNIPDERIIYSGFCVVNEHNRIVEADYTDYKYKYRDTGDPRIFDLDNDGIPYIPSVIYNDKGEETVYEDIDTNTNIEISYNKDQINNILDSKIEELSNECKEAIEFGADVMIDNSLNHFSYSLEKGDQINIEELFNMVLTTGEGQYYHADGKSQTYFEPYEIFEIYSAVKLNKLNKMAKYNQMVLMLKDMFSQDKEYTEDDSEFIDQVSFTKTKLKGDFHKAYIANTTKNNEQMETIKQKLINMGIEFPVEKTEEDK